MSSIEQDWNRDVIGFIAVLRRMYEPRWTPWTDLDREQALQRSREWIEALRKAEVSIDDLQWSLAEWINGPGAENFPALVDLILPIHRRAHAQRVTAARSMATAPQCDGSGWLRDSPLSEDRVPCPTCNPFVREVYDSTDVTLWPRYLTGIRLNELHPDVTVAANGTLVVKQSSGRVMPPRCRASMREDPNDRIISPSRGRAIAWDAYVAECHERGRLPSQAWFDSVFPSS